MTALRDVEMLNNIRIYCRDNVFDRGLFLVGCSHRRSIKEKVGRWTGAEMLNISWDFMDDWNDT
jgi:hypothetical protein